MEKQPGKTNYNKSICQNGYSYQTPYEKQKIQGSEKYAVKQNPEATTPVDIEIFESRKQGKGKICWRKSFG